jgi:hypothetical protein
VVLTFESFELCWGNRGFSKLNHFTRTNAGDGAGPVRNGMFALFALPRPNFSRLEV